MSAEYEALPRHCLFEVVRVYRDSLGGWSDKCSAAFEAMAYLKSIYGEDARAETEVALRYARATGDHAMIDAFLVIIDCLTRDPAHMSPAAGRPLHS
ncbi:hypothetical protein GCM10011390_33680 [Aureimonas endophytica]|uniref:Uncharacterized protein n=1 Tax=Aureimonas endophytica TaxID=2027858 RepID=A0A917E8R8_9HYPH|nr:hypothetical protein [Aureimonas endophytica]GGE11829.1 hypothetical protein GCM10011390_33680 [Aureimonas endophytica]